MKSGGWGGLAAGEEAGDGLGGEFDDEAPGDGGRLGGERGGKQEKAEGEPSHKKMDPRGADFVASNCGGEVPAGEDAGFAFVAEEADGGGSEGEVAGMVGGQANPLGGEDAEDVRVGEQGDVAGGLGGTIEDVEGAGGNLGQGFAAGHAIAEKIPGGAKLADAGSGESFVFAVVPLAEIGIDLDAGIEAGKAAGFAGALEGGAEDKGEIIVGEVVTQGERLAASVLGEGDIGAPGMLTGEGPFGFAVANEPDLIHLSIVGWRRG